jgi:DNA ligase (NAD+)
MIELYQKAKDAYYRGEPIMSDQEFDLLEQTLGGQQSVGSLERTDKEPLPCILGSLNQIHNQSELDNWDANEIVISEKLDGNSMLLKYNNGILTNSFSRGNGIMGASNYRHSILIPSIPKTVPNFTGLVRGEVVIKKSKWGQCRDTATSITGKEYKNARNFVAGFLNGKTGIDICYQFLDFVALEVIDSKSSVTQSLEFLSQSFIIPNYQILANKPSYDDIQHIINGMYVTSEYVLDGCVIVRNDQSTHETVTETDMNPGHAIKVKPKTEGKVTTVTSLEWNVSKDGLLKPIVHFTPIELDGATISKASGYNAKTVVLNGYGVGAIIVVERSGAVIPKIIKTISPVDAELPNGKWDVNGVELTTDTNAEEQQLMQLEYFFKKLEVDQMGESNVKKLFDLGIDTPSKAILAENFDKLGANGKKAFKSMKAKLNGVKYSRLMAAMGVFGRGIGERRLDAVMEEIPLETFISGKFSVYDIKFIHGFDDITANQIAENFTKMKTVYSAIENSVILAKPKEKVSGKLVNQVFCATGVRFNDSQKEMIESLGGEIKESISSAVTILVTKDPNSTSAKILKAKKMGIKVISMTQFQEML